MSAHREFDPPRRSSRTSSGGEALLWIFAIFLFAAAVGGWWYYSRRAASALRAAELARLDAEAAELRAEQARLADQVTVRQQLGTDGLLREVIIDDARGQTLWASPTSGQPFSLAFVPAGTQCLVHLRPALLGAHAEGEKALAALGPWRQSAVALLEAAAGAKLAQIDAVLAAIVVRRDGEFDVCLRVELLEPRQGDVTDLGDMNGYVAFTASPDVDPTGRTRVICPVDLAAELAASAIDPPLLARDIENLVEFSDRDRVATVVVSPKFLDAGGASLLAGRAEPVRAALDRLVSREATAVSASVHWDENFFVELRAAPALSTSPRWLATVLHQRVAAAGDEVAEFVAGRSWSDYGRTVIERLPAMLRKLADHTRSGEADRQAVLRAYLPAVAGHNLLMGAELLLTQGATGIAEPPDHVPRGLGRATVDGTMDERLLARVSLAFPRESLQRALELWAEQAGVEIDIDGGAFEAAGVTRNQALELEQRDRPAGEVLVEILRRANPDRTADSAADPRQTLVYLVEPRGEGGGRIIITTRAASADRGVALPAVFDGGGE
jgi:hypothetical protein